MKMIVAALFGGIALGWITDKLLAGSIQKMLADPPTQNFAAAGVAAFLGVIFGWVAKGMLGEKPRD